MENARNGISREQNSQALMWRTVKVHKEIDISHRSKFPLAHLTLETMDKFYDNQVPRMKSKKENKKIVTGFPSVPIASAPCHLEGFLPPSLYQPYSSLWTEQSH